jgi:hypothetical protein
MDDIIKLKADIYDLMAQIQQLQSIMTAKNNELIELIKKEESNKPKK